MHKLVILDRTGHTTLAWRPVSEVATDEPDGDEDEDEDGDEGTEAKARELFDTMVAKGYTAYALDPGKIDQGQLIRAFDPEAREILLAPALVGG